MANLQTVQVSSPPATIGISNVARRDTPSLYRRETISCSNTVHSSTISQGYREAQDLAQLASSYIINEAPDSITKAYFGENDALNLLYPLGLLYHDPLRNRSLSCTDPYGKCGSGVDLYSIADTGNVRSVFHGVDS